MMVPLVSLVSLVSVFRGFGIGPAAASVSIGANSAGSLGSALGVVGNAEGAGWIGGVVRDAGGTGSLGDTGTARTGSSPGGMTGGVEGSSVGGSVLSMGNGSGPGMIDSSAGIIVCAALPLPGAVSSSKAGAGLARISPAVDSRTVSAIECAA